MTRRRILRCSATRIYCSTRIAPHSSCTRHRASSWVAMRDPVGPSALYEPLIWTFIENCDGMAVSPVFYQVTPDNLPLYIDRGIDLEQTR